MATPGDILRAFLAKHRLPHGADTAQLTHQSFGAGPYGNFSYVIPDAEAQHFLQLYTAAVEAGDVPTLCERPLATHMPLIVDLDISIQAHERPTERLWDATALISFASLLNRLYRSEVLDFDPEEESGVAVLVRPEGYWKVKPTPGAPGTWLDGVHIQSPELSCPAWAHRAAKKGILDELELANPGAKGEALPLFLELAPGAVVEWDAAPLASKDLRGPSKKPWFLVGSTKVDTTPYEFLLTVDSSGTVYDEQPPLGVAIKLLSLRMAEVMFPLRADFGEGFEVAPPAAAAAGGGGGGGGGNEEDAAPPHVPQDAPNVSHDQLEALLALLSDERAQREGREGKGAEFVPGAAQVVQAVFNSFPAERGLALAFAQRSTAHWASGKAAKKAEAWFAGLWKPCALNRWDWRSLLTWAEKDNSAGYKAWLDARKGAALLSVKAKDLPPAQVDRHVAEVVSLSRTGFTPIPDKHGNPKFHHKFLYGTGAGGEAAGLNDLSAFQDGSVVLLSPMGTGKTVLFRALSQTVATALYVSARRTFTRSMAGEFQKAGLGFRSYLEPKCSDPAEAHLKCGYSHEAKRHVCQDEERHMPPKFSLADPRCRKMFTQVESLHRHLNGEAYELVVLDEIESIVAALSPGPTQRDRYLENVAAFEALVRRAKVVVAGDAFFTDRSREVLAALRPEAPLKLLENTWAPVPRVCERIKVMDGLVEKRAEGKARWHGRLKEELKAGKRVAIVCGSVAELRTLEEDLLKPHQVECAAAGGDFKFIVYYAERPDRDARNSELADVNSSWAAVNVVATTATITVGISYDHPEAPFDMLFFYGTRMGATVRDMFQTSMRWRHLRENRMVFYLSSMGGGAHPVGLAAIERSYAELDQRNRKELAAFAAERRAAAVAAKAARDASTAKFRPGGQAGDKDVANRALLAEQQGLPPWLCRLMARNQNEAAVNQTAIEEMFAHYLERCGYTVKMDCPVAEELLLAKVEDLRPYREVPVLSKAEMEAISERIKEDGGDLPMLDRQAVRKFFFRHRCGLLLAPPPTEALVGALLHENRRRYALCHVLRFLREGRFNVAAQNRLARRAAGYKRPKELAQVRFLTEQPEKRFQEGGCALAPFELWVRKDGGGYGIQPADSLPPAWATPESLETLWSDKSFGYGHKKEEVFKHVALEKLGGTGALDAAGHMDAKEMRNIPMLGRRQLFSKLRVAQRLCAVMELDNSATEKTWSDDEFRALIPKLNVLWDPADPDSLTISDHARAVFGVREHRQVEAEDRERETTPSHLLQLELDSVLKRWSGTSVKRSEVGSTRRTPASPAAGGGGGGGGGGAPPSPYDVFRKAKMEELKAEFPNGNDRQKEVGRLWALEKTPSKKVKLYEYRTEPALGGLLWVAVKAQAVKADADEDGEGPQFVEEEE